MSQLGTFIVRGVRMYKLGAPSIVGMFRFFLSAWQLRAGNYFTTKETFAGASNVGRALNIRYARQVVLLGDKRMWRLEPLLPGYNIYALMVSRLDSLQNPLIRALCKERNFSR